MANDKSREPEQQQNISEVLEMLRQSYVEDDKESKTDASSTYENKAEEMSDDDLQRMLRRQFMTGDAESNEPIEESYGIDEEFLEEVSALEEETERETERAREEKAEEKSEEVIDEELPWDEDPEEEFEEDTEEDVVEDLDDDGPLTAEELALIQAFAELDDEEEDGDFAIDDKESNDSEDTDEKLPWDEDPEDDLNKEIGEEIENFEEESNGEIDEDLIPVHIKDEEFRFMEYSASCEEIEADTEDEFDDDLTFDQLEEVQNEDEGIELLDIPSEESDQDSEDLTFDQIDISEEDDGIAYTPIEIEEVQEEDAVEAEETVEEGFVEEIPEEIPEEISEEKLEESDNELVAESIEDISDEIEEMVEANDEEVTVALGEYQDAPAQKKCSISNAELSLLLQFGCDDEILEIASDEEIEQMAIADSLGNISDEDSGKEYGAFNVDPDNLDFDKNEYESDIHQTLEEKVFNIYDSYSKKRGGVLVRLLATAFLSILLLLYDGLPILGVQLPGIMDRKEYFLAYVLIGMQLLVLSLLPSLKQLWNGIKRMFSRNADAYSMLAALTIVVFLYDIFIMVVKIGTPHVFHFIVSFVAISIVVAECVQLTEQMKNFRYFFEEVIEKGESGEFPDAENQQAKFTLKRSAGKGSTADKMYKGGLDPTKNVFVPIDISSAAGYFNVCDNKTRKSRAPMVLMLPSMIVSLIMGIFAFVVGGAEDIWVGVGTVLITLLLTLPIGVAITSWLPFEIFNEGCRKQGFAFVNESTVEQYSNCDVFVFRDMHIFEKCSPKSVNLATYDATSKEVLIGCLSALYSEIGGPLASVFALGSKNETNFGSIRLRRVAKSGVEALVGANYSLLVGNEQFMARYGIKFPAVSFKHPGDEIYSLCISINGRASARLIVKYTVKEMFEMFAKRLEEDGIYCAVETLDPMISSRLLIKLRGADRPPVSVIHLGIDDVKKSSRQEARPLGEDAAALGLIAKKSRLNLAVATTSAKKMISLRKKVNLLGYFSAFAGAVLAFLMTMLGWGDAINEFYIFVYWVLLGVAFSAVILMGLPSKERFSAEVFRREENLDNMAESILTKISTNNENNQDN
jgi:hypothetical protein